MRVFLLLVLAFLGITKSYSQVSFGETSLFNDSWLFNKDDAAEMSSPNFDDSKWRRLELPHDWSIEGLASPTLASCTGYLPAGVAWYRKHFDIADLSERAYIYFEGVYNRSEVYLNGHLLGKRPNGYISFMYDMTPYLKEKNNVLAVRVDHSRIADSRWYTGSGIYRDVWMVRSGDVHFAQWGLGWKATSISNSSAQIDLDVEVEKHENQSANLVVKSTLFDADGKVVSQANATITNKSKGTDKLNIRLKVRNPKRWQLHDPYLYKLECQIIQNGKCLDKTTTRVGLRTISFDANKGFSLNGQSMKVKGVCLHHDAGVLGSVVPKDVWRRRIINLKEMGANAIRMSHNPQAPVVYDLCDELGMLVMDEASDEWEFPKRKWVEGWNVGKPAFDGTFDFFEEWIERDVTDMVRRDRNHPSVFLWSIGNEVDYPNDPYSHPVLDGTTINQPMFGGYKPDAPDAMRIGKIAKRLSQCVRSVDTSRPVTGALAGVVMSNQTEYPEAIDVVGYNYTENRYDEDHKTYPTRIFYGSETHSSMAAWKAVRDREHIFGQFVWTGTDYLGESGRWPSRGLHTGLLDFGSYKKPRGWFRASLWSYTPVTYIGTYPMRRGNHLSTDAPDLWNYEDGQKVRVVCYTNSPQARLLLNGKVVGEFKPNDPQVGIIHWDINYEAGTLLCEGCDADGNKQSSYEIKTSGRPYQIKATLEDKGEDIAHVLIEVLDENGTLVKLADNEITCRIFGDARLLGLENSDNSDMSDHRDNRQRVFRGKLLAYVKLSKVGGLARMRFSSPLLKGCELVLE